MLTGVPDVIATILVDSFEKIFSQMSGLKLVSPPEVTKKEMVLWQNRMRILAREKSDVTAYVSVLQIFRNDTDKAHKKPFGVFAFYADSKNAMALMDKFGIRPEVKDTNDIDGTKKMEMAISDCCGELTSLLVGKLKGVLMENGYSDFICSSPVNYAFGANDSVDCPKGNYKYEVRFQIEGVGVFYFDVVLPSKK